MIQDTALWIAAAAALGLLFGAGLAWLLLGLRNARLSERLAATQQQLQAQTTALRETQAELRTAQNDNAALDARLQAEKANTADKIKTLTAAREQLTHEFKTLSQDILEQKSRRFNEQSQASLKPLLDPLKERISRFEQQVRAAYDEENRQRSALSAQIKMLEAANKSMAEDALNLSQALRGESKTQGNWGEMILETVLERSGLQKGTQYDTQFALTRDDGRRQLPDAVVHLPQQRSIIIDAKVSLTAYLRVHDAETEADRHNALNDHLASVRRHLKDLSAKQYHDLPQLRTLDYVFMFIPSEAAYVEALRGDFALQREALDKNIALVSPTTLMPMLRAVSNLWRLQKQEENAADIASKAGALHDKFVGFLDDMDKLGRALATADKSYDSARRKLVDGQGNIVRRSQQLRELGAAVNKQIDKDWRDAAEQGNTQSLATADRHTAQTPTQPPAADD